MYGSGVRIGTVRIITAVARLAILRDRVRVRTACFAVAHGSTNRVTRVARSASCSFRTAGAATSVTVLPGLHNRLFTKNGLKTEGYYLGGRIDIGEPIGKPEIARS